MYVCRLTIIRNNNVMIIVIILIMKIFSKQDSYFDGMALTSESFPFLSLYEENT